MLVKIYLIYHYLKLLFNSIRKLIGEFIFNLRAIMKDFNTKYVKYFQIMSNIPKLLLNQIYLSRLKIAKLLIVSELFTLLA